MAEYDETPDERIARINEANARIGEAIANESAMTSAQRAEQERRRADAANAGNNRLSQQLNTTQFARNAAEREAVVAQNSATNSAFGFWLLAGFIVVGLIIAGIFMSTQAASSTTGSNALPPTVITRTVESTPSPTPLPTPTPTVNREYIPVPAPAPAKPAAPAPQDSPLPGYIDHSQHAAPAPNPTDEPSASPAPSTSADNSDGSGAMNGYIAH